MPRRTRLNAPGTLHHVKEQGMSLAEVARLLGISASAISKILQGRSRGNKE